MPIRYWLWQWAWGVVLAVEGRLIGLTRRVHQLGVHCGERACAFLKEADR